jgi:type VI secretion system protein ImpL
LSQAGKIGAQAQRAYRNALTDALFPRLALALEDEIRQGLRTQRQEGLRDALEAYQSLYAGGKTDAKLVEAAALRNWRLPDADSAALLAHLRAGLEEGVPEMRHPQDEAIIRDARQKLAPTKNS